MIISNPKLFPQGIQSMELATLVDVLPTLIDIMGVESPSNLRGVSLLPVMETGESVQDSILFTFDDTKSGSNNLPSSVKTTNRLRTIRTKEWKYTYYFDALGSYQRQFELYNLIDDENEVNNLAYSPKYKEIREDLHRQLLQLEEEKLRINEVKESDNEYETKTWVETNAVFETYAYNDLKEYEGVEQEEK